MAEFLFTGMNTVVDPASLDVLKSRDSIGGECVSITNMDTLAPHGVRTRLGYTEVLSTAAHSAYEHNGTVYLVSGGNLCTYTPPTTLTPLTAVNATLPMVYEPVNNLIVATNGQQILIIEAGAVSQLATPTEEFKVKTPAGNYLAFYNGRLYVASGNTLHCTDPFSVEQCDERQMYIPITPDAITGIVAVDDGLYVGTTKNVFFLGGADPYEGGFSLKMITDYGSIPGTMKKTQGSEIAAAQMLGAAAVWASPRGFCVGGNSGTFKNLSDGVMALPDAQIGNLMIRDQNGLSHIVAVLGEGSFYNQYQEPSFEIDEAEIT